MGTKHLIAVVLGGEFKIAQYGQWDGYPEGQGASILKFLTTTFDRDTFVAKLANVYQPTNEQVTAWYAECGHDGGEWVNMAVSDKFKAKHPSLSRDIGANILDFVQASDGPVPVRLQTAFAGNSRFCEWAYVVDLDGGTLEVFRGFNHIPTSLDSRFPSGANWLERRDGYEPVALAATFPLASLPDHEAFIATFAEADEDEADAA